MQKICAEMKNKTNNSSSTKDYYCDLASINVKGCVVSAIIDNTKIRSNLLLPLVSVRLDATPNVKAHEYEHKLGRIFICRLCRSADAVMCSGSAKNAVAVREQFSL